MDSWGRIRVPSVPTKTQGNAELSAVRDSCLEEREQAIRMTEKTSEAPS